MEWILVYLIGINVSVGILYGCHLFFTEERYGWTLLGSVVVFLVIFGGGVGLMLSLVLLEGKPVKENLFYWLLSLCLPIVQGLLYALIFNLEEDQLNIDFVGFIDQFPTIKTYLFTINVLSFFIYGWDKFLAIKGQQRIKNLHLLGLVFLGGTIGILWAVYFFRHKRQKDYYRVGIPLMMVMHFLFFFYMMQLPI